MTTHIAVPSYAAEAPRHLRTYDWIVRRIRRPLAKSSLAAERGIAWIDAVFADTRAEFARLIPQIPYIGEGNVWKLNIVAVTMYLALYRVLKQRGWTVDAAGQFLHQAHEAFAGSFPRWLRRLVGWAQFTPWFVQRMKAGAERSGLRRYPMDWVFDWVPVDGKTFDYGFDIRECAVVKYYHQQGADELTPYLCIMDHFLADTMGYQFRREGVLATGSPCCDCRYKPGLGVNDWPPSYPLTRSH